MLLAVQFDRSVALVVDQSLSKCTLGQLRSGPDEAAARALTYKEQS